MLAQALNENKHTTLILYKLAVVVQVLFVSKASVKHKGNKLKKTRKIFV